MTFEGTQEQRPDNRRRPSLDRFLLLGVLALQVCILAVVYRLWQAASGAADRLSALAPDEAGRTVGAIAGPHRHSPYGYVPAGSPAARTALSPWEQARWAQADMDRMVEQAFQEFQLFGQVMSLDGGWESLSAWPGLDMRERDDAYVVLHSLSGLDERGIAVTLDGRLLTILAPYRAGVGRREPGAAFERKIWLPGPVDEGQRARADVTNGVLRVVLPKADRDRAETARVSLRLF